MVASAIHEAANHDGRIPCGSHVPFYEGSDDDTETTKSKERCTPVTLRYGLFTHVEGVFGWEKIFYHDTNEVELIGQCSACFKDILLCHQDQSFKSLQFIDFVGWREKSKDCTLQILDIYALICNIVISFNFSVVSQLFYIPLDRRKRKNLSYRNLQ